METITRDVEVRGRVDMETGRFPMVLATEGEASDGHILSISGMEVPEDMPLLWSHQGTEPPLGSVLSMKKGRKDGVPVLRAEGEFDLEGEGAHADFRRDMAGLVDRARIKAVSIRWDGIDATPRSALPKTHKAYEPEGYGLFFSKSRAREGSIVNMGADMAAHIGRSDTGQSEASRLFMRTLVDQMRDADEIAPSELAQGFDALVQAIAQLRDAGVSDEDLAMAVRCPDGTSFVQYRGCFVPETVYRDLFAEATSMYRDAVRMSMQRTLRVVVEDEAPNDSSDEPEREVGGEPEREAKTEKPATPAPTWREEAASIVDRFRHAVEADTHKRLSRLGKQ